MENKENIAVLITGAGIKEVKKTFNNDETDIIKWKETKYKLNIGSATAKILLENGYHVIITSKSSDKLELLKNYFISNNICAHNQLTTNCVDLLNEVEVEELVKTLPEKRNIWLVHSVGLSSQSYTVKDDNPYLEFEKISLDLLNNEIQVPINSLLLLMQNLRRKISNQRITKLIVITSMSAIRPYVNGFSHLSAKAALHNAVRSLTLEFAYKYKSVFVSEILPGIVDTGMYDSDDVIETVSYIGESFGVANSKKYTANNFPTSKPSDIGKAVLFVFESKSHILSINLVAQNQFPHSGA